MGKDGPPLPSRRHSLGVTRSAAPKPGQVVAFFDDAPSAWVCGYQKLITAPNGSTLYLRHGKEHNPRMKQTARPPTGPPKGHRPTANPQALLRELSWSHNLATHARPRELGKSRPMW